MLSKPRKNFTEGPIFMRMVAFALPVMLTGVLQILYGMADNMIVGKFSSDIYALGAVGSTTSLNNLVLHLMLGLSVGSGVVVAQAFGAKREDEVSRTAHTAMTTAVFGGLLFMAIGLLVSEPALTFMGTKPELLDKAILYYRIICIGIPATAIYNYGAAILRAVGDSKTPLIILSASGILNVLFNLFFVLACGMSVEGVAIATIISQYASAIAIFIVLVLRRSECYSLSVKKYCFDKALFKKILRFGIPSGIQSSMFGISNVLLTSAMNSFNAATVSAYSIAMSIDGLTYTVCSSFATTALTFAGQNYGAMKLHRIKRVLIFGVIQTTIAGLIIGLTEYLLLDQISMLYMEASNPFKDEILYHVRSIATLLLFTYFLCGIMEVISATLRSMGYAFITMFISIGGICGLRALWVFLVFPTEAFNSPVGLMTSYPVTWSTTALGHLTLWFIVWRMLKKRMNAKNQNEPELTTK